VGGGGGDGRSVSLEAAAIAGTRSFENWTVVPIMAPALSGGASTSGLPI